MFTDGWKGYDDGDGYFIGHGRVNHSKEFTNYKQYTVIENPDLECQIGDKKHFVHIQNIESNWGRIRTFVRKHKGCKPERL